MAGSGLGLSIGWVIMLDMGSDGQLLSAKLIHEQLKMPVSAP
jgi:hypothetical protein